jgi:hypothetical protein
MFDETDRLLSDWISGDVDHVEVVIGAPTSSGSTPRVFLHLLNLLPAEPVAGPRLHPLQLRLEYLVCVDAPTVQEAHALLGRLAFNALQATHIQPVFRPIDGGLWQGLGIAPRPGFFIQAPVRLTDERQRAPRVEAPPEVAIGALVPLDGKVVGSDGRALAEARVSLPRLGLSAITDRSGGFRFSAVPSQTGLIRLLIESDHQRAELEVSLADSPLVVAFSPGAP